MPSALIIYFCWWCYFVSSLPFPIPLFLKGNHWQVLTTLPAPLVSLFLWPPGPHCIFVSLVSVILFFPHSSYLISSVNLQMSEMSSFTPLYITLGYINNIYSHHVKWLVSALILCSSTQLGKQCGIGIRLPCDHPGVFTWAASVGGPLSLAAPFTSLSKMSILSSLEMRHKHKNLRGESPTGENSRDLEVG